MAFNMVSIVDINTVYKTLSCNLPTVVSGTSPMMFEKTGQIRLSTS